MKINDYYDIVQVLDNWTLHQLKGKQFIISDLGFIKRTIGDFNNNPINGYFLLSHEFKRVGRIKIKTLK